MPAKWIKYYKIESFSVLSFLGIHLQGYLGNTNSKYSRSCPFLHYFRFWMFDFKAFILWIVICPHFFQPCADVALKNIEKHLFKCLKACELILYSTVKCMYEFRLKNYINNFWKNLFVIFMASQRGRSLHRVWVPYIR